MTSGSLNILVINWQDITNPFGGGAEVHLHEIFKRVVARGHRVTLLCSRYEGAAWHEVMDGLRIVRTGSRNLFNFHVPRAYRALARETRFDIVVDDLNKIPFYTPLFVKEPILALVHHFFGTSIYLEVPFLPASYVYLSERLVPWVYRTTPFAAVSESSKKELAEMGIRSDIQLLPNGIDIAQYPLDSSSKSEKPLVGYFGRVKKYKSIDHVLQAWPRVLERVPEARLLIIGDGEHRPALEALAGSLGIEKSVEFLGYVSHADKISHLNRLWVAVNPSPKEGWGLTVIEANACGVPVVAADSPGLRDSVVDGDTGRLYPYGDIDALAERLVALLKNEKHRKEMSRKARQWAERFSWDVSAEKAIEIIDRIVSN